MNPTGRRVRLGIIVFFGLNALEEAVHRRKRRQIIQKGQHLLAAGVVRNTTIFRLG